jgi:hypothetical protein
MYDEQCTKDNAFQAIQQICSRCGEDDYFILYYSGHGTNLEDDDGDEDDGQDEALCFVDANGQISFDTCMRDDDLAECISEALDESTRVLILTDCCHSGTIADLDKDVWEDRQVISITGCLDSQTSGDIGKGGIFTHSMLLAIDQLQNSVDDGEGYSVGMLYNATLENDDKVFNSAQDITMQSTRNVRPDGMAWPLIPQGEYRAPLTQATQSAQSAAGQTGEDPSDPSAVQAALQANPQMAAQFGINPAMVQFIHGSGLMEAAQGGKLDYAKLAQAGYACYQAGGCEPLKKCTIM